MDKPTQNAVEAVTVYIITQEGAGFFASEDPADMAYAMIESEPGTAYTVTVEEWSRDRLEALPEWEGW